MLMIYFSKFHESSYYILTLIVDGRSPAHLMFSIFLLRFGVWNDFNNLTRSHSPSEAQMRNWESVHVSLSTARV